MTFINRSLLCGYCGRAVDHLDKHQVQIHPELTMLRTRRAAHTILKKQQPILFSLRIQEIQANGELAWMHTKHTTRHPYVSPTILVDAQYQSWLQFIGYNRYYESFEEHGLNLQRATQLGFRVVVSKNRGILTHEEILRSLVWHTHYETNEPPLTKNVADTKWYWSWVEQECLDSAPEIEWWVGKRFAIHAPFVRSYWIKIKNNTVHPLVIVRRNVVKSWVYGEAEFEWRKFNPKTIIGYQTKNMIRLVRQPPTHPLPNYLAPA